MNRWLCVLTALVLPSLARSEAPAAPTRHLIFDHDGGSDDFAAMAIALLANRFKVDAITICPADSLKRPATQATVALVKLLGFRDVKIAAGDDEGVNHFPMAWRKDSERIAQIPDLNVPRDQFERYGYVKTPARKLLVELLSNGTPYEILATGPLSNIAEALRLKPSIAKNITRIYFMGGALNVPGNVVQVKGRDGSAEWNVYNNPKALAKVLDAGVPITFVPLDATNKAPVTREFMDLLAGQKTFQMSRVFHLIWNVISSQIQSPEYQQRYFFWDTLTAAYAVDPTLGTTREERIKVVLSGRSQGRTQPDENGAKIDVLTDPQTTKLHRMILSTLKR